MSIFDLVPLQCPVCGVRYGLDKRFHEYREKGGTQDGKPASWCCPNGHSLVIGESEADELRRERDRLRQQLACKDDLIADQRNKIISSKGQITKLQKRAKAGTCPCCNRTFTNMARHMQTKHPDFNPKVVKLADAKKSA